MNNYATDGAARLEDVQVFLWRSIKVYRRTGERPPPQGDSFNISTAKYCSNSKFR